MYLVSWSATYRDTNNGRYDGEISRDIPGK